MRLTHVTVKNFKSVEDSGEFSIGDVTCLVGKNEAGKTALLQALHHLNPDAGEKVFDVQSSYPRRFLSEYDERHTKEQASVLVTKWQLTETEIADLEKLLGPKSLTRHTVTIEKHYKQDSTSWSTPVDEVETAAHLIANSGLHAEEQTALAPFKTVAALKAHLDTLGSAATERHKALSAILASDSSGGPLASR